jgi:dTMP kinase
MATTGRFIVFEGGEGSGKSTQAKLLAEAIDADLTREPGGTKLAEEIRELLLHADVLDLSPRTELLLMVAARAQHVAERITPTLTSGRHVVCDRFSGSTLAYQGYGRGLPLEDVVVACEIATEGVIPDLNILLDLPPELATSRRGGAPDRIEAAGTDFHARVAEGFRAIAAADPSRWAVVDALGPVDEVSARVQAVVSQYLGVEL